MASVADVSDVAATIPSTAAVRRSAKRSDWSTHGVSERDAHPRARRLHLRNAVLEAALRGSTGDKKVAMTEPEGAGPPTSLRAQEERARLAEGHEGIHDLGRYAVAVPGNTVGAVAIEIDPHRVELDFVVRGERHASFFEPLGRDSGLLVEPLPGGEPRFVE
jgi:hypothetical protein